MGNADMISTCTSDISLILDQGRHYLVTQVHIYNLYRELGNLKYARDEWKFFSEYEDPVRCHFCRFESKLSASETPTPSPFGAGLMPINEKSTAFCCAFL